MRHKERKKQTMRERIAAKKRRIRHYLNDEETKQNEQRETEKRGRRKREKCGMRKRKVETSRKRK